MGEMDLEVMYVFDSEDHPYLRFKPCSKPGTAAALALAMASVIGG